ncbi:MAG TPA: NADH-quinone oxidoreductase subunit L [Armatimonadota bacterium]|nr:NADH-quinone oxidoreductase subunit L [Armatimonadota bacterium]
MPDLFENAIRLTWLIPVFPLVAFGLILLTGRRGPGQGAYVAIGASVLSFVLSMLAVAWTVSQALGGHEFDPYTRSVLWAVVGGLPIRMGFVVDQLAAVLLVVVAVVALLVQIYSIGYMRGDPGYPRFFAYLSLFSAAMLALAIADNLLLFYVSWELVGLMSYLLIGFWFERPAAMRAAKKAFIVTRLGDVGLFLGMVLLFSQTGELNIRAIFESIPALKGVMLFGMPLLTLAGLLIFAGAVGKSAQFPLHVWLPDAMEGPTPVSALIHAATMVAAGVYLVGRMYPVFAFEPNSISLTVVAVIGAVTALTAATIATVINDIKRVLAYSTISQLGYMMLGLGVGGYTAGLFHLLTHAFFKANLFLGSGSVIRGAGTQDIQQMGGLGRHMPRTYWTFLISAAALAGLPFTAGFFSKDEILLEAFHANAALFWMGLAAAFLTAFYMTRLVALTFWGEPRSEMHVHESAGVMTWPMIVLAFLSVAAGYVAWPTNNVFHRFLHFGEGGAIPFSWTVALLATSAAGLGILLGWAVFVKRAIAPSVFRERLPWAYKLLASKYYLDELYWAALVVPLFWIVRTLSRFDERIVDGFVNGVGYVTVGLSLVQGWIDKWVIDALVNLIGGLTKFAARSLRLTQTGIFQDYAAIMFLGVLFAVWVYLFR